MNNIHKYSWIVDTSIFDCLSPIGKCSSGVTVAKHYLSITGYPDVWGEMVVMGVVLFVAGWRSDSHPGDDGQEARWGPDARR